MPTTDLRGHTIPEASDAPSQQGWVLDPIMSVRDPIPVASVTARAQKLVDLAAVGVVPSSATPVFFFRTNAGIGRQCEYTTDGTTFETLPTVGQVPYATAAGTVTINTTAAAVNSAAIVFPASRFTVAPIMPAPNIATAAGGTGAMTARVIPASASGGTVYLYASAGGNLPAGIPVPIHWTAFQMKSTAAAG